MECSEPGTIRDEELLAYVVGEKVRSVVVEHVAHCQHCSARLADYRRIESMLTSKLYRWDCPPNQVLGEYQLGMLSEQAAAKVRIHLSTCVLCAAELVTLTEFLASDPLPMVAASIVPISVRPSSQNNHRRPVEEAKRALDRLRDESAVATRRIVATLLPPQPRFATQRHPSQVELWPRRYAAEDLSISVQVERGASRRDSLQLIGFVTRKGAALESLQGVPVLLSSPASTVYTQSIDELGNFVFSSISPATYTLELQFPNSTVVIEQLPVALRD